MKKYHTSEAFDLVKLHDCVVNRFEVTDGAITLEVDFAYLEADHPQNPHAVAKSIKPCELIFEGVNQTRLYPHVPDEQAENRFTIDPVSIFLTDIQRNRVNEDGAFWLAGVPNDGSWMEWEIFAEKFELRWDRFGGDAWYAEKDDSDTSGPT